MAHILSAQETILSSGSDTTGSGGSSSYSVGQLFYNTNTSATGSVIQGVQQSLEIFTLSNHELTSLNLKAVTYPNPSTDYVVLSLNDANLTNVSYALYDIQGRLVAQNKVLQASTKIEIQALGFGTYVLQVQQNNKALKTFKIIKK
ncbi:T9SS type A sorting domain-containing protein [Kordia sp.]|uniref:T9SS type A sorting domain-containing protein n=1 Tax=Kordia sp. TaxID=1965332 RepID=UPI0025C235C5|nr:T9SS type A sorting domain-containing protein [Kordia sp.]